MKNKKNTKKIFLIIIGILIFTAIILVIINIRKSNDKIILKELPKPEITGGSRGELGIDKNINESTIDEYLNRPDSVYRDMRMLEDPALYENIDGDRYLSGYIEGFEVISLPYILPVAGLPAEVGNTYSGTTLFYNYNGTYIANYEESMKIIEEIFPKNKVIFLMCGGGGYAGMTKNFLVSLGWDADKIYNVGGYWYYKGKHSINVKQEKNGVVSYNFNNIPYHEIDFTKLTKTPNYKSSYVSVTKITINTTKLEVEEETKFKLNAIILPNEATNKEVKWESSDEKIATVSSDGIVKAIKNGKATITVKSVENGKTATCEVTVNKRIVRNHIKIDDLSKEIAEFSSYDLDELHLHYKEYPDDEYDVQEEMFKEKRLEIFNKLIDDKKTFIVVIDDTDCGVNYYDVASATKKVLNQNNYQYFVVSTSAGAGNGDIAFMESKLDRSEYTNGAIAIIKEGKLYVTTNPGFDAFSSEEDIKNWLGKYIDI